MRIPFKFDAGRVAGPASPEKHVLGPIGEGTLFSNEMMRKGASHWGHAGGVLEGARRFQTKRGNMRLTTFCRSAAIAVGICLAAGAARADDDQVCDNIMDELKKLSERLMNTTDPKGIGPVCAATGQLLGIIKASREVAAECYDEGRKRDRILLTFDKASKDMESKIDSVCK